MTTYEGWHNHDIPVARTITRNPAGTDGASIAHNDGERIKSEEDEAVSADAAVGEEGCNHTCKSTEQQDGKSEDKCDASRNSAPECEGKLSEQHKGDPSSHCKSQVERGSPTGSAPQGRSTQEQANRQLTAKPMKGEGVASGEEMNSSRS